MTQNSTTTIISSDFTTNTYIMCKLINGYTNDCINIPKKIKVLKYVGDLNGTVYNIDAQEVEMVIGEYNLMTGTPVVGLTYCVLDDEEVLDDDDGTYDIDYGSSGDEWEVFKFNC